MSKYNQKDDKQPNQPAMNGQNDVRIRQSFIKLQDYAGEVNLFWWYENKLKTGHGKELTPEYHGRPVYSLYLNLMTFYERFDNT